jgi:hypothetical protein
MVSVRRGDDRANRNVVVLRLGHRRGVQPGVHRECALLSTRKIYRNLRKVGTRPQFSRHHYRWSRLGPALRDVRSRS